jgi:DNA-binding GntR family transcriptional regulator
MPGMDTNIPAHETVYRAIRDRVLFGDLAPGQSVTIQGLVDDLGVSMTPVREAIRRLTAEGALEFLGNRRVCVPEIGERRFAELAFARLAIEPRLAELASTALDGTGADALAAIDAEIDQAIVAGDVAAYMRGNYRFHFTLYRASASKVLLPIAETLWLRFGPLQRIICGLYGTRSLVDLHEETIARLAAGDHKGVGAAIRGDIEQGFAIVREAYGWSNI